MLRASAIIEKAGIPTASLVCDGFLGQAAAIRSGLGVPDMPLARIVGHVDTQSAEELTGNLQRVTTPDVIARLTQAPDADETAPPDAKTGDEDEIVARGSFEEINATFEDRQWTDGLPVVPPTREKVDAFLGHAADAPDWEIGVLLPSGRIATLQNVAVNGVMAGCRPVYMPVLVAITEALADHAYGVQHSGDTTGGEALVILSGPMADHLGFNSMGAALRDGYRANTSVGRFVRLMLRNVAGSLPEGADKSTFGNTWRVVLAEQAAALKDLGWPSLSQDQGFDDTETTVTVARYTSGGVVGSIFGRTAAEIIPNLADGLTRQLSWELGAFTVGVAASTARPLLVLSPMVAGTLAADGLDKADLKQMLFDHARLPAHKLETFAGPWGNLVPGRPSLNEMVESGMADPIYAGEDPDRLVPIAVRPGDFMVVVAGDPLRSNAYAFAHNGMHGYPTTKRVRMKNSDT